MRPLQLSLICSLVLLLHSFYPLTSARRRGRSHHREGKKYFQLLKQKPRAVFEKFPFQQEKNENEPNYWTTIKRLKRRRHHLAIMTKRPKKYHRWTPPTIGTIRRHNIPPRSSWATLTTKVKKKRPIWTNTAKKPKKRHKWTPTTTPMKRLKINPPSWALTTKRTKKKYQMTTIRPIRRPQIKARSRWALTTKRTKKKYQMTTIRPIKRPQINARSSWALTTKRTKKRPIRITTMPTTKATTKRPIWTTTTTTKRPAKKFAGYKKRCNLTSEADGKHSPCSPIRFLLCDQQTRTCLCDPNLDLVWDKSAVDLPFETMKSTGYYLDGLKEGQCRVREDKLCVENLIPCVTGTNCQFSHVTVDLPKLNVTGVRHGKCVKN